MKRKINSLYIHIPFCKNICPYCDFTKLYKNEQYEDKYIDQLLKNLSVVKDKFFKFETIYIGGGTPSCLSKNNLEKILISCSKMHKRAYEFSIEANPEDINIELLELLKKYGINRISIGVQTFDEKILDSINRNYHLDFGRIINLTKKYINNINLDFIYGLPGYSFDILKKDLDLFFKLDVNHASFYSLIVSPGTIYFNKNIKEIDEDLSSKYYLYILKQMRKNGFERYEVSNYSKQGFECKHNLSYWKNKEYVGIGLGSSGYIDNVRYTNTRNLTEYNKGKNNLEKEEITIKQLEEYYFITNLRLADGFSLVEYKKIFGFDFLEKYKKIINPMIENKQVIIKNNKFACTDSGLLVLDLILLKLFEEQK
jgi:oxygen-independent coproporphyrinogen III oxidase